MLVSLLRACLLRSPAVPTSIQPRGLVARISPRGNRPFAAAADARAGSRASKLSYALGAVLLGTTSYVAGALAPPAFFQLLSPRYAPPPLPADSEEGRLYTERIERELNNLEILKKCRGAPDAHEWYETRPYTQMSPEKAANSLTAGALRGPGKIAVAPLVRSRRDEKETWLFIHLGRGVCGHDGIVHGGLLATLLDEGCGRNAVLNVPSHVVLTANLNIDYKAPTRADQFVVMKTRLAELKGRKAIIEGRIEDLDGNVLAQARALFIEPKIASVLNLPLIQAIYPTSKRGVAAMTGASARGGQAVDEDPTKGS